MVDPGKTPPEWLDSVGKILLLSLANIVGLVLATQVLRTSWPWVLGVLMIAAATTAATVWVRDHNTKHDDPW
jgi:hypothetical protein